MPGPLRTALTLARHVEAALRASTSLEVPTFETNRVRVFAPGKLRLVEDLTLASRTYDSVHFLMSHTPGDDTPRGDHTESAAVLLRRLIELLAQVYWLTGIPPPDALTLPGLPGEVDDYPELLERFSPDPIEQEAMALSLASVQTWTDIQALRSELRDIDQSQRVANAYRDTVPNNPHERAALEGDLDRLAARRDLLVSRLRALGAPMDPRWGTVDLLKPLGPFYVVAYRYETDVTHAHTAGRNHQRGGPEGPRLGAPATPSRKTMVMQVSNAFMLHIAERVFLAFDADVTEIQRVAAMAQTNVDSLVPATPDMAPPIVDAE